MGWFDSEKEDLDFQATYFAKVQEAYPDNLTFTARIINGVNFITLDDSIYVIYKEQFSPTAVQYVVGGAFKGEAYNIQFL